MLLSTNFSFQFSSCVFEWCYWFLIFLETHFFFTVSYLLCHVLSNHCLFNSGHFLMWPLLIFKCAFLVFYSPIQQHLEMLSDSFPKVFYFTPACVCIFKKICCLVICPEDSTSSRICSPLFIAALFTIAKKQKQPRYPTTNEWIIKMWHKYTMEYYSTVKANEGMNVAGKWMQLEEIILNKVTQTQNDKHWMLSFTGGSLLQIFKCEHISCSNTEPIKVRQDHHWQDREV